MAAFSGDQIQTVTLEMQSGQFLDEIAEKMGMEPNEILEIIRGLASDVRASLMDDWLVMVSSRIASLTVRRPGDASSYKLALDAVRGLVKKMGAEMSETKKSSGRSIRVVKVATGYVPKTETVATRPKVDYNAMAARASASQQSTEDRTAPTDQATNHPLSQEQGIHDPDGSSPVESSGEGEGLQGFSTIQDGDLVSYDPRLPPALRRRGLKVHSAILAHMGCESRPADFDELVAIAPIMFSRGIQEVMRWPGEYADPIKVREAIRAELWEEQRQKNARAIEANRAVAREEIAAEDKAKRIKRADKVSVAMPVDDDPILRALLARTRQVGVAA